MTGAELNILSRRYTLAQSLSGRLLLQTEFMARELFWAAFTRGPELFKRGVDITFSLLALILLIPLFALIYLLIKFEDRGSIFFIQTRVGQHGHHFKMYKFRSMCLDAEQRLRELLARN